MTDMEWKQVVYQHFCAEPHPVLFCHDAYVRVPDDADRCAVWFGPGWTSA